MGSDLRKYKLDTTGHRKKQDLQFPILIHMQKWSNIPEYSW